MTGSSASAEPIGSILPSLQKKLNKYNKQFRTVRLLTVAALLLLIISFFIRVPRYKVTSEPMEYPAFTQSSTLHGTCSVDSIAKYEQVFVITHTTYRSGISYGTIKQPYYLVTDKNGFTFLICMEHIQENSFLTALKEKGADAQFHGKVTELDFDDINMSESEQRLYKATYGNYPVLKLLTSVDTYKTVPTVSHIVLIVVRVLLAVFLLVLRIWFAFVKREFYKETGKTLAAAKQQQELQKILSCPTPVPTEAPEGYDLWTCPHCGMKNSTQYAQCKRCGKFKGM